LNAIESNDVFSLVRLISSLEINNVPFAQTTYHHMGATISDAILQAGLNYKSVVYPRIIGLTNRYPDYVSTSDFIILFKMKPLSELLRWRNKDKLERIQELAWFLFDHKIENEADLANWFSVSINEGEIINIKGIGNKTVDYLKKLSGVDSIPIDRHLFKFLEFAGVKTEKYDYANYLYTEAAKHLNIGASNLDSMIWHYMLSRNRSEQLSFY